MIKELIFGIIGGLGLFIFGIKLMGLGLQKLAGSHIRKILGTLTKHRIGGILTGAGITAIIQSSSATTVMLVGFVNAGLMNLTQSLGVTLGADIGTTITAQIIAFKLTAYALPLTGIGAALHLFAKKKKHKHLGEAIFGFGLLFLGLNIMTSTVQPLGQSEAVKNIFVNFSRHPLLGVLAGMIVTAILQSSSVTVGLIIALASVGLLTVTGAIPLVLGANIGTCITAILASIGTTISARRTAIAHVLFKAGGTIIALVLLPVYYYIVTATSTNIARQVANAHTLFNVVNTIIFLPLIPLFVRFIIKLIPGEEISVERGPKFLEKNLINTPSIALDAVSKELVRMAELAREMVKDAFTGFRNNDRTALAKAEAKEDAVDELQDSITRYLVSLTQTELSNEDSEKIPSFLHSVNDVERIGDHAVNIIELAERKIDNKLPFSKTAEKEMSSMYREINLMLGGICKALPKKRKKTAKDVLKKEDKVNTMTEEFRGNNLERLRCRRCKHLSSVVFIDMLMNLEKIGDHASNIAQAILGRLSWNNSNSPYNLKKVKLE
ncbi:Na/Pi cotransporter family protein [Candidatus Woesearchaeota archaeon]|nr:Na/Pi cotransporter family protein [Candidatus Woesearchaeota archaeon]